MERLTIETVALRLTELGASLRRKVSAPQIQSYYRILSRHLDEESFEAACDAAEEHDAHFPAPATLLDYGRAASRNRREIGEPYVLADAETGEGMRLRDLLNAVGRPELLPLLPSRKLFDDDIERWVYENAAEANPYEPGEDPYAHARKLAGIAQAELVRVRELEAARKAAR